jgi:quinol monooxygenase YgiN
MTTRRSLLQTTAAGAPSRPGYVQSREGLTHMKFIFEVRMKPGYTVDEYSDAWVRASKIIQRTPGAQGTYLHRKIGDPTTLLAIATWESKAHRDAKNDRRDETVRAILDMHAKNCEITVVGEFDEPQWSVLPEQADL